MAALSLGLGSNDNETSLLFGVIVCIVVGFTTNALYSVFFSFNGVMSWYQNTKCKINSIVSGLFAIAGIGLIYSAFTEDKN